MRPVTFPYTSYHGSPAPIIPVEIRGNRGWEVLWAYVDSGAAFSIFRIREAEVLGLRLEEGSLTHSVVGDGSLIPVYLHRVPLRIGAVELAARVGFSPRLGVGFNLLGRQDLFTHFDVTFSDTRQRVIFTPVR